VLRLARLLGIAYLIALALAAPYLADALRTSPPKPPAFGSMDLASLWLPRAGRSLGLAWLARAAAAPREVSDGCRVGIPLLAVAVAVAIRHRRRRLVWLLTGMLVLITIAALGPQLNVGGRAEFLLPWHAIFSLPFVRSAYPTRLMLFAFLGLAVATAMWLARTAELSPPGGWRAAWPAAGRWSLGVLVVAFLALNASVPAVIRPHSTVPEFITSGQYHRYLRPGEIAMVVSSTGNAGMLWQADSGLSWRLAGGFINAGFNHRSDLPAPAAKLEWANPVRVAAFEAFVRTSHIGVIFVDARSAPSWVRIFPLLGLTGHKTGGVVVYPTDGCRTCRPVRWEQLVAAGIRATS